MLVHPQDGGLHAAAHHGQASQLAEPLHRAVLPVFAVQHRENRVQMNQLQSARV